MNGLRTLPKEFSNHSFTRPTYHPKIFITHRLTHRYSDFRNKLPSETHLLVYMTASSHSRKSLVITVTDKGSLHNIPQGVKLSHARPKAALKTSPRILVINWAHQNCERANMRFIGMNVPSSLNKSRVSPPKVTPFLGTTGSCTTTSTTEELTYHR